MSGRVARPSTPARFAPTPAWRDALPEQAVQGSHYRFAWDGKTIARLYDFTEKEDIDRADIFSAIKQAA